MMKGLITKEILVLIKNNRTQMLIILCFAVLGVFLKNIAYFMFIPLLIPMIVKQGLAVDETSKWDRYSICFPVDKKKIVSSKYLVLLLASVLSFIIAAISFIILNKINKGETFSKKDFPVFIAITGALSIVLPSVTYPFDFKYGTAKGRIAYFIMTGIAVAAVTSLLADTDTSSLLVNLKKPMFIGIFFGASVLLFIISWFISAKIYEAREI